MGRVAIGTSNPAPYQFHVFGGTTRLNTSTVIIGNNVSTNTIRFYGTNGDNPVSFNTTVIAERVYEAAEKSELLLFKGDDSVAAAGPDRVRVAATGGFQVDIASGSWNPDTAPGGPTLQSTNCLVVAPSGYVGIGNSAPSQILHLSRANTDNYIKIDSGSTSANYAGIMFSEQGINYGWTTRMNATNDNFNISYQDNTPTFTDFVTFTRTPRMGINQPSPSATLDVNGNTNISGNLTVLGTISGGGSLIAGQIIMYGAGSAPSGWLECDGSAVSRSTYSVLFAAIGTTWGSGDGVNTFNLPDLRGRAPIGRGTGSGLSARTLAQQVGAETHTLSEAEMPTHNHGITDPGHFHGAATQGSGYTATNGANGNRADFGNTTTNFTNISINNAGSSNAHNNMQPSLVVLYIIKT